MADINQDRRQYVHDRIGGLCTRYMTLVAPLSGGVVEQAYRLRDDIMAVLDAEQSATDEAITELEDTVALVRFARSLGLDSALTEREP